MRFHICLSRPQPGWEGRLGRINSHVLEEVAVLHQPVCYLVGNGDMVHELKQELIAHGLDRKRQIRTEAFTPTPDE